MTDPNYELAKAMYEAADTLPGRPKSDWGKLSRYAQDGWLAAARAAREHIAGEAVATKQHHIQGPNAIMKIVLGIHTESIPEGWSLHSSTGKVCKKTGGTVMTFAFEYGLETYIQERLAENGAMLAARTDAPKGDAVPLVGYMAHVPELVEKLTAAIAKVRGS